MIRLLVAILLAVVVFWLVAHISVLLAVVAAILTIVAVAFATDRRPRV